MTLQTAAAPAATPATAKLLELFSLCHEMQGVQRFSRIRMTHPENVLAHTGMVCVIAYVIALQLPSVSMEGVLRRAVAHDMDETLTGDITRPTKYYSDTLRTQLTALGDGGVTNIASALGVATLRNDHSQAKKGHAGFIVKLADVLAALCTVWCEVSVYGNKAMMQPVPRMRALFKEMRSALGAASADFTATEVKTLERYIDEAYLELVRLENRHDNPLPSLHGGD